MTQVAILTDTPRAGQTIETAFGFSAPIETQTVNGHDIHVCAQASADPRATVRALKDLGATHLWLCESVGALSPLLETGDWIIPDDYIDGTRGHHYTYFTDRAGGYVQQVPPLDPSSREALLGGAHTVTTRPFQRSVYVCVSNARLETPAEALFWGRAGGHVVGRYLSPSLTLARELEMKIAVLGIVTRTGGASGESLPFSHYEPVLGTALEHLQMAANEHSSKPMQERDLFTGHC
jgi:5'-methylthioadenosine phosphorylase